MSEKLIAIVDPTHEDLLNSPAGPAFDRARLREFIKGAERPSTSPLVVEVYRHGEGHVFPLPRRRRSGGGKPGE